MNANESRGYAFEILILFILILIILAAPSIVNLLMSVF